MGMIPSCKEMTWLVSTAMEGHQPLLGRILMTLHLLMCPHCTAARDQLRLLHDAAGQFDDFCTLEDPDRSLSREATERIKAMLKCPPSEAS